MKESDNDYLEIKPNQLTGPIRASSKYQPDSTVAYPTPVTFLRMTHKTQKTIHLCYADLNSYGEGDGVLHGDTIPDSLSVMQRHDNFELMLVINGLLETHIEDGRFQFFEGDAYLLNRNTKNKLILHDGADCIALCLSKEYLRDLAEDSYFKISRKGVRNFIQVNTQKDSYENKDYIEFRRHITDGSPPCEAKKLYFRIFEELKLRAPGYTHILRGLVLRLFSLMDNPAVYSAVYIDLGPSLDRDTAEAVKKYLEDHKRIVSRREIAERLHYSVGYISRIFKKITGFTVKDYNQKIYMDEARRLIVYSDLSISHIAQKIGFSNRTQFYNLFKQMYGETPQIYRNLNKKYK